MHPQLESNPHLQQLEKACVQQQRPSTAKKKKKVVKGGWGVRLEALSGWEEPRTPLQRIVGKGPLEACSSECGPWTSSISIT